MKNIIEELKGGLIVSCQAEGNDPLIHQKELLYLLKQQKWAEQKAFDLREKRKQK